MERYRHQQAAVSGGAGRAVPVGGAPHNNPPSPMVHRTVPSAMATQKDIARTQGSLVAEAKAQAMRRCRELLRDCARLLESMDPGPATGNAQRADLKGLKERDLELIRLLCHPANWPYAYIAVLMRVPLPTLHRVRGKLFKLLGVHSRIELVRLVDGAVGEGG